MFFLDIENVVFQGSVDVGLIIYENCFIYQDKGLVKLMDLGDYWEEIFGLFIFFGGIVVCWDLLEVV